MTANRSSAARLLPLRVRIPPRIRPALLSAYTCAVAGAIQAAVGIAPPVATVEDDDLSTESGACGDGMHYSLPKEWDTCTFSGYV